MSDSSRVTEFRQAVERNAEGTPYDVTATADGFDVGIALADARWYQLYAKAGLKKTFVHHVRMQGERDFTITDDSYEMSWEAGHPRLGARLERFVGRKYELSMNKTIALSERGRVEPVVDYRFSSEEGRGLIKAAARELGLREHMPASAKFGLWFALAVLVSMAILFPIAFAMGWMDS
jgi:hypothetical protein